MAFYIIRNDIARVKADAIVNSANPEPGCAGGAEMAIYKAAGREELLRERQKIGRIDVGSAEATPAFGLQARYILHTVSPVWEGGDKGEREKMISCYQTCLTLARRLGCESIAFPLLGTGNYGYPKEEALTLAVRVCRDYLEKEDLQIYLVVFDPESFKLSGKHFSGVREYVDRYYVDRHLQNRIFRNRGKVKDAMTGLRMDMEVADYCRSDKAKGCSLDQWMENIKATWQESLFHLIDAKGYTETEVYKRANVDRKLFSKIRNNTAYQPKKNTAVAFALALRLNTDETRDFLGRAGYALSPSSRFDLIVEYFIEEEVYDIYTINLALFDHDQPLLGA